MAIAGRVLAADGSPPDGFSVVVPAPGNNSGRSALGTNVSLAIDANDDPPLAYVWEDPNGDGSTADSTLYFVRWDGTIGGWRPPMQVDVVAEIHSNQPLRQVALARDAITDTLGIAYVQNASELWLAVSGDGGVSWARQQVNKSNPGLFSLSNPALAIRDGAFHLAYWHSGLRCTSGNCGALVYLNRRGLTGAFSDTIVPMLPGTTGNHNAPAGLAVDVEGRPGLAYLLDAEGSGLVAAFWRPGASAPERIADSRGASTDEASASIAFAGTRPRVLFMMRRDNDFSTSPLWFSASEEGTRWSDPVRIPQDRGDSMQWDQALALDDQGHAAVAAYWGRSSGEDGQCGGPKLAWSEDLVHWNTCGADTGRLLRWAAAGRYVSAAFASNGRLELAYQNTSPDPELAAGVIFWYEPPLPAPSAPSDVLQRFLHRPADTPGLSITPGDANGDGPPDP